MSYRNKGNGAIIAVLLLFVPVATIICISVIALITHIVWCIGAAAATGSAIALLVLGLFFFPIGILHGVSLWIGYTWIDVPEKVAMLLQWFA